MGAVERWGDTPLLVDTSAWNWASRASADIQADFAEALRTDQLSISPIAKLELLYTGQTKAKFDALDTLLSAVLECPLTESIGDAAIGALRDLKNNSDGYHRVSVPDVLIAATAQECGFNVLHYDAHYVRLAEVMTFTPVALAPMGTLDQPEPTGTLEGD